MVPRAVVEMNIVQMNNSSNGSGSNEIALEIVFRGAEGIHNCDLILIILRDGINTQQARN